MTDPGSSKRKASAKAVVAQVEAPAPSPMNEADALMLMIERAARDSTLDLDRLERIVKIREDMLSRQSHIAYASAMAAAQAACIPVARNKTNTHTKSQYADLAALADAVMPIIHGHGFGLSFSEFKSQEPNCLGVRCEVSHAEGCTKIYDFNVPIDGAGMKGNTNKTDTQAYGSTFTYGRRYATLAVFNVAVADQDGNKQPPQDTADERSAKIAKLRSLIADVNADEGWICNHHSVESLNDLTGKDLATAITGLEARKRHMQKGQPS